MIHIKKEFGESAKERLKYAFGGGHEHKVSGIEFIPGTMLSVPVPKVERHCASEGSSEGNGGKFDASCGKTSGRKRHKPLAYDWTDLSDEFDAAASFHCGKGEKLFGHYIVSLAPEENLTPEQWQEVLMEYMDALGYDESTKFCGLIHNDTEKQHMHVLTCRVKLQPGGVLVDDRDDHAMGMKAMRGFEKKYGLQIVENPKLTWGVQIKEGNFKRLGNDREAVLKNQLDGPGKDWAAVIRSQVKKAFSEGKPRDMTKLVDSLRSCGVEVRVRTNRDGEPEGISYSIEGSGVWIAGSRVKAARLTWQNLIKREGIRYDPHKHNLSLGLPPRPETLIRVDAFQVLNKRQAYVIERTKLPVRLYRHGEKYYAGFGFEQVLKAGKERYEEMVRDQLIKLVLAILDLLFGHRHGRAGAPILTSDMDIPSGLEVVKDDVGDEAWRIEPADDERFSLKKMNEVGENLSVQIRRVHKEWISPRTDRTGSWENAPVSETTYPPQ